ncbi:hypothetical protein H0H81_007644 [Sphagnurus paluster]|uniref:DUF6699 domain-containing protein n=1 Tax=Sphagnurus paluster TaxID=117069 RepID=A0A9P7K8Q6_9AGAR|nr:hypothetical protein H0H81_007644 [Sphagnurus paluster]
MNPPAWANPWQSYYAPNPAAGYMPPPHSAPPMYGDPRFYRQDVVPRYGSKKYPKLYHILASDSTRLVYDLRKPPQEINGTTYLSSRYVSATETGAKQFRIISKAFPWTIDIDSPVAVTCEAVWEALHYALQEPIVDSEWGLILSIKKQREVIEKAAKKRMDANRADEVKLRRIDYLGEATMFRGLDKDDDFDKARLLPGAKGCTETWVVSFSTP